MDTDTYTFSSGQLPILVSMPHNGTNIPKQIKTDMHDYAHKVVDTDWYMDKVYEFATTIGCHILSPRYSRYVIDLNRPSDNQSLYPGANVTELCPTTQFDLRPIYRDGKSPDKQSISQRVDLFWRPYHKKLEDTLIDIRDKFGYALLFEAHSIKSVVPRFFEGQLPDFNFGTYDNTSCGAELAKLINEWQPIGYSKVINARFKGGYITRHYGNPKANIDAVQLELSQATYMDEQKYILDGVKLKRVTQQLRELFDRFRQIATNY